MTTIERVDVVDAGAFGTFHDVYVRSHQRAVDQPYTAIEKQVNLRADEFVDSVTLLARDDDGTPVGGGTAGLPLRDNTGFVYLDVFVVPEARGRGHGTAVIEAMEEIGREAGRHTLFTEGVWEIDAVDPAAQLFLERLGFRLDLMDAVRELALPASLPALEVADGYTLHSWRDVCPDEWVHGYVDVRRLLMQEALRATPASRTSTGTSNASARRSGGGPSRVELPR